jgi:hypothetical protein
MNQFCEEFHKDYCVTGTTSDAEVGRTLLRAVQAVYEGAPRGSLLRLTMLGLLRTRVDDGTARPGSAQTLATLQGTATRAAGAFQVWHITEHMFAAGYLHAGALVQGRFPVRLVIKREKGSERSLLTLLDAVEDFSTWRAFLASMKRQPDGSQKPVADRMLTVTVAEVYRVYCEMCRIRRIPEEEIMCPSHVRELVSSVVRGHLTARTCMDGPADENQRQFFHRLKAFICLCVLDRVLPLAKMECELAVADKLEFLNQKEVNVHWDAARVTAAPGVACVHVDATHCMERAVHDPKKGPFCARRTDDNVAVEVVPVLSCAGCGGTLGLIYTLQEYLIAAARTPERVLAISDLLPGLRLAVDADLVGGGFPAVPNAEIARDLVQEERVREFAEMEQLGARLPEPPVDADGGAAELVHDDVANEDVGGDAGGSGSGIVPLDATGDIVVSLDDASAGGVEPSDVAMGPAAAVAVDVVNAAVPQPGAQVRGIAKVKAALRKHCVPQHMSEELLSGPLADIDFEHDDGEVPLDVLLSNATTLKQLLDSYMQGISTGMREKAQVHTARRRAV